MKRKYLKKALKMIAFFICIIFIIIYLQYGIISLDYGHKICCKKFNCITCDLIKYAIVFTQSFNYLINNYYILYIMIYIIGNFIYKKIIINSTLIDLKVRLDE